MAPINNSQPYITALRSGCGGNDTLIQELINLLQSATNVYRAAIPMVASQNYLTVTNLNLAWTPSGCVCTVVAPLNGTQLYPTLVYATLSSAGFQVTFNGTVPATGYYLNVIIW